MFLFKKIVSAFLMPLPVCLLLLLVGVVCLWWGRHRLGTLFSSIAALLLVCVSSPVLMGTLLTQLETIYPPNPTIPNEVAYVVVLGNWNSEVVNHSPLERLSDNSKARLIKGFELYRAYPKTQLILSGYAGLGRKDRPPHAEVMAEAAKQLGIKPTDIIVEPRAADTYQEATMIAERIGKRPFLLVTDASHMRRAVALFRGQGVEPIPVPTNFRGWTGPIRWQDLFPRGSGVAMADRLWWELLGYQWAQLRGQFVEP